MRGNRDLGVIATVLRRFTRASIRLTCILVFAFGRFGAVSRATIKWISDVSGFWDAASNCQRQPQLGSYPEFE